MLGYITMSAPVMALFIAVGLLVGMSVREYARARVAVLLGDPTPRLWGRLSFDPRSWFDPFGSGLIPGLIVFLFAVSAPYVPPFAYAKPAPIDPNYLKGGSRSIVLVSVAGPASNLVIAIAAGLWLRTAPSYGVLGQLLLAVFISNVSLALIHLLPIPGLDGARMVALLLQGNAKRVYRDLDSYLPLFALAFFLVFGVWLGTIVYHVTYSLCGAIAGPSVC
jgi:Zn-dependent protease